MQYKNTEKFLNDKGLTFKYYPKVSSTMKKLKKLIEENDKCFFVVAEEQSRGIGRRGNLWYSPKGNIYLSFNLKLIDNIKNHYIFSFMTALSISNVLNNLCNVETKIKWPNDIYIKEKKISGLISEIYKHNKTNYIIIGVGINVSNSPEISDYPTTYVKEINKNIDKITIINLFVKNIFIYYKKIINSENDFIKKEFKEKLLFLNEQILIKTGNDLIIKGILEDINIDGSIKINVDGQYKNIYSGRILNDCY